MVFVADRHATGGDDQVVALRRPRAAPRAVACSESGTMPRSVTSQPSCAQQRAEHEAVAVVDRTGAQRLAGHRQFVAGEEAGDAHATVHRQGAPDRPRRPRPVACGVRRVPARQDHSCPRECPRRARRIHCPGSGARAEDDVIAVDARRSCITTASAPSGMPGAGEDPRRDARRQRLADGGPRGFAAPRAAERVLARAEVGTAQCVAVHLGVVHRRNVQGRAQVGDDTPRGVDRVAPARCPRPGPRLPSRRASASSNGSNAGFTDIGPGDR